MSFFFDYIYYRITKYFFKREGSTGGTSLCAIVGIQCALLLNIYALSDRLINGVQVRNTFLWEKALIAIIVFALFWYNKRKYDGKYLKYRSHWKDEPHAIRIIKGILVLLTILIPWVSFFIIGIYLR